MNSHDVSMLTVREVAELLQVSRSTLHRWARDGTLVPVRVGGLIRYRRADIERLLADPGDVA